MLYSNIKNSYLNSIIIIKNSNKVISDFMYKFVGSLTGRNLNHFIDQMKVIINLPCIK